MMIRVATPDLAGESMANLAVEYHRINHSFLQKTLTTSCGTLWNQTFCCASLGISEAVPTVIPALLTPEVIEAVRRKAVANRTSSHGHLKNKYLFSRVVFCGNCGYAMSGEIGRLRQTVLSSPVSKRCAELLAEPTFLGTSRSIRRSNTREIGRAMGQSQGRGEGNCRCRAKQSRGRAGPRTSKTH